MRRNTKNNIDKNMYWVNNIDTLIKRFIKDINKEEKHMLQQVMTKPGEIIFREVPIPEIREDQVLVKIMNIGIFLLYTSFSQHMLMLDKGALYGKYTDFHLYLPRSSIMI